MLKSLDEMLGYRIESTDGEIGRVKDFYFDDHRWEIRYLVVDTGGWIFEPRVLISPADTKEQDGDHRVIELSLTKHDIKKSPSIYANPPVSHQYQAELAKHQGSSAHEIHPGGPDGIPPVEKTDPHLRSAKEVMGYRIEATDQDIGHVEDLVLETGGWTIRYLVIDTRNWLPGKKVIIDPAWIVSMNWANKRVTVDLTAKAVKNSPEFDPETLINREYETSLYNHYGRPGYWTNKSP